MSDAPQTPGFKPKKSVALSGTAAGNTALCTVGRSGNDLHYRGYDILDFADEATFEEIAHLLVHGHLPTISELNAYKTKLMRLRGLPTALKAALEWIPASAHPMDVMRTGCSVMGTLEPELTFEAQRDKTDRLLALFPAVMCYWYRFTHHGVRIDCSSAMAASPLQNGASPSSISRPRPLPATPRAPRAC